MYLYINQKTMKKILSILALTYFFVACENDVKSNSPAFQGEKDNVFWRAKDSKVTLNPNNSITLNAYTNNELVTITVPNTVGVYDLGTINQNIGASYSYNNELSVKYFDTSLTEGAVYKLTPIVNAGSGYAAQNNTTVATSGGSGNGLTLNIKTNASGSITEVVIASRGTGYKPGDVVTLTGGSNNARIGVLNLIQSNGVIEIEKIEGKEYTGTFMFNAVDDNGNVVNFNKGNFYKIPAF